MSKYKLSPLEKTLLTLTITIISISIILSLCIGLILPPNFVHKNKVNYNLIAYCLCNTIQKSRQLNCMPRTLEDSLEPIKEGSKQMPLILYHSYLVSLSVNAYNDDNVEKRFVCTGVIVSYSWILAGQDCIIDHNEWLELQVRAGSVFWSKGGTVHKIKRILHFYKQGPVCLRVYPHFFFNQYTNAVKLSNSLSWKVANSTYWKNANNKKNKPYYVETWSKKPCKNSFHNIGELRNSITCNITLFSTSLVVNEVLVGFQVGICKTHTEKPVHIFLNFQNSDYATWLTEIIQFGEPQYYGISIRNDEFVTYIYEQSEKCVIQIPN